MIQELHENGVRAICVFDGKERSPAKQREVSGLVYITRTYPIFLCLQTLKRCGQRNVARARGTMEMERLSRLTRLTPLITSYESLPKEGKVEVTTSLRNTTKGLPTDQHPVDGVPVDEVPVDEVPVDEVLVDEVPVNEVTFELETDKPDAPPDYSRECTDTLTTADGPSPSVTGGDPVGSALDEVTSDMGSLIIATEHADAGLPPTQTIVGPAEGPAILHPSQLSSMLAALYYSFLASVRPMGALLSPRTVLPRPEEQDDETEVTQELSQAQRRLVTEEGEIWKQLLEETSEEGVEGDVSLLARELEDKSAKILTSYERRNNPPTNEVYTQSKTILQAMGVPCINAKGGVEGEALAAAIVRDGFADYVASEDTVSPFPPFDTLVG